MLLYQDNLYHYHSKNARGTSIYWRCFDRKACNARCTTNEDFDNIRIIRDGTENHLHPPNVKEVRVREILNRIRRRANANPTEQPAAVVRNEVSQVNNEEVLASLPQRNALTRLVSYQQNRVRPPVPLTLGQIIIEEPYTNTLGGENFLIYDSGLHDDNRILMFSTARNMQLLSGSDTIFSDGTYKTVPNQFVQLFSIHGLVRNYVFPLVYCLTVRQTEETYASIYRELNNYARVNNLILNPTFSVSDFELANINACRETFPNISITTCLFHFTQSIWRNVTNKGLRDAYLDMDHPRIRHQIQEMMALPFIPLQDLTQVWELLNDQFDEEVLDLASYIEATYITGRAARGRRRAVPPRFPPAWWNVYDLVANGRQRTNNAVEGFHSQFQRLVVAHHVNIWRFIEHLQQQQNETETLVTQVLAGHINIKQPLSKRYLLNQQRVTAIVHHYQQYKDENDIPRYLRAISYHLKLHSDPPQQNDEL